MYIWNGLKIYIDGKNRKFISNIGKYFYATYTDLKKEECDIVFSLYESYEKSLPKINKNARLANSHIIYLGKEINLEIYAYEEQLWYFYIGFAEIWVDFKSKIGRASCRERV